MFSKITLIFALCIAQSFALRPNPRAGPWKPVDTQDIALEFEETVQEIDNLRETVSMAALDAFFNGNDPEIVVSCFQEQKRNYTILGQRIFGMMKRASKQMNAELGEEYKSYSERAEVPITTIGITIKSLTGRMWFFIKDQEFTKALEVMQESRRIIYENSRILAGIMKELAVEVPEAAEKADVLAREIHEEAKNGCRAVTDAFRQCVSEGVPAEADEADDAEPEQ